MLELRDISKTYGLNDDRKSTIVALEDINLAIEEGEFVSIIGPTGCGKSTLFETIGGLVDPTSGSVLIDETQIDGPAPRAVTARSRGCRSSRTSSSVCGWRAFRRMSDASGRKR